MKRFSWRSLRRFGDQKSGHEPLPPLTRRIFAVSFTSEFMVIYSFYVIMFGKRGHVSSAGIGVLLATWMITSVVAEVPTGIIADRFSKKWSLVCARVLQCLVFTIWLFTPNFTGYLVGIILWGISGAFDSGAFQAYLYESLNDSSKKTFGKIYARASSFNMMAYMAGGVLAFVIGPKYNLDLLLSIVVSIVALVLTLGLPATRIRKPVEVEIKPKIIASALKSVRNNPALRRILFGAIIMQGLMGMLGEYLPAYYQQVGTPTRVVALLIATGSAVAMVIYWWMHHFNAQISKYQPLIILAFTGLFALSFMGGVAVAVVGFFLFTRMLRVVSVNNDTQIQHHAPDESRATLGSLYSFAAKILAAGLLSLVGATAVGNKIVIPIRWSIITLVLVLLIGNGFFWLRQHIPDTTQAAPN